MIIIPCEQGSREWIEARLGVPTASAFNRLVTATGRISAQRERYIGEMLAEWVTGEPYVDFSTEWTERGKVLEPDARRYYAFYRDLDNPVQNIGFALHDSRMAGCSPDGVIGDDGLIELKCPGAPNHILYLSRGTIPREYRLQVQGQLWVTGREWCDFMSYHPEFPPLIVRATPDPVYQEALTKILPEVHLEMTTARENLVNLGVKGWNDADKTEEGRR